MKENSPNQPVSDDTPHEKVTSPEAAPKEGVEREDARSSEATGTENLSQGDPGIASPGEQTPGVARAEVLTDQQVQERQPVQGSAPAQVDPLAPQHLRTRQGMWGSGSGDTSGYGGIVRPVSMPGDSARPYGGWFDAVADRMQELVPGFSAGRTIVDRGEITFFVRPDKLVELARVLRDDAHLRFEMLPSVSGVHYPGSTGEELHVVYHLLSVTHNRRIRLEVALAEDEQGRAHLPSVVSVYPHADWHERETWDMFGIVFEGHPALTRILMPDDWSGHPQRKDYPLGGVDIEYKGAVVPPPEKRRSYS